jgi:ABC-type nitrate/sulfonate/bicarbonate transport system substrate-binding protein
MTTVKRTVMWVAVAVLAAGVAAPTEAFAQAPAKVTMIQTFPSMAFGSLYAARAQNFFEQEGIDLDLQIVSGDAIGAQGLVGGTAPMAAIGGAEAALLASKGIKNFISVSAINRAITVSVAVRKDLAESRGLTANMPIEKRVAALKGMRIATGSPGGAVHTTMLYLLSRAGLDPQADVTLVSVGGGPAMLAGLKSRQLDAIAISPPAPEQADIEGAGVLLISLSRGDVPELANIPYDVLLVHRDYAARNPDTVRRVVRAIGRGSNVMRDNPALAKASLLKYFDKVPVTVMDAVAKNLQGAFAPDGRQNEEMWKNLVLFMSKAKKATVDLDPREGVLWTNEFIGK